MEFELRIGPQGHVYLPKRIRETFGQTLKLLPNMQAAAIFPKDADPESVIASLQVIIGNLQLSVRKRSP